MLTKLQKFRGDELPHLYIRSQIPFMEKTFQRGLADRTNSVIQWHFYVGYSVNSHYKGFEAHSPTKALDQSPSKLYEQHPFSHNASASALLSIPKIVINFR